MVFGAGCGQGRGELREWRAEDHQPPAATAATGQGSAEEGGDPQERAVAALWGIRCATCHGMGGRGDGEQRPPGTNLPDLSSAAFHAERTDAQLREVIAKGRGLMPAFGEELSDEGIDALVQHLRRLKKGS